METGNRNHKKPEQVQQVGNRYSTSVRVSADGVSFPHHGPAIFTALYTVGGSRCKL